MGINFIPFAFPGLPRIHCIFSLRQAGDFALSATKAADLRKNLFKTFDFSCWQEASQVHGCAMVFDPPLYKKESCFSFLPEADGLGTSIPGQALAIKTADCQPLFLAHTTKGCIAALHVGWRGNVMHFPQRAVDEFCTQYSLVPADILALRGPSLGPGASEFIHFDTEFGQQFSPWYRPDKKTADLWQMTRDQLIQAGLKKENIFSLDLCTKSLPQLFFSHRRKETERMINFIWFT